MQMHERGIAIDRSGIARQSVAISEGGGSETLTKLMDIAKSLKVTGQLFLELGGREGSMAPDQRATGDKVAYAEPPSTGAGGNGVYGDGRPRANERGCAGHGDGSGTVRTSYSS